MTEQQIFERFITKHFIQANTVSVPENPHFDTGGKPWDADHWLVKFSFTMNTNKRAFKVYFSKGIGLRKKLSWGDKPIKPTAAEVLECLHSDFSGIDQSFEDWASDLGYSSDSRSAERTYDHVQQQARDFAQFIGREAYAEFLAIDLNAGETTIPDEGVQS